MGLELHEYQRLPTSGARAVVPYFIDGVPYLAVPQLAEDIEGEPPDMNGGTSDLDALVYRWEQGKFAEYQRIPSHGGECIAVGQWGGRHYMAVAHIRSGRNPDFNMRPYSMLYEWDSLRWFPRQSIATFAAKHCALFELGGRQCLAFSEGVSLPGQDASIDTNSHVFAWGKRGFEALVTVSSKWGYCTTRFDIEGQEFVAFADNSAASVLYRWTGTSLEQVQTFGVDGGGRHFAPFEIGDERYLAYANLLGDSEIHRWTGERFELEQGLEGPAGRNFAIMRRPDGLRLIRTNFISGTRTDPVTTQTATIYRHDPSKPRGQRFVAETSFETHGGTESAAFEIEGQTYVAVSNSLNPEVRFRTDTLIYRVEG